MMKSSAFTSRSFLLALVALFSVPSVATGQTDIEFFDVDTNSTECLSIADIVCHTEGLNLNALCEAISLTELTDDLDEDAWTLFAPDDGAFEALGRDNLDSLVFGNDTVPLTDLLLFHIIPGVTLTSDLLPCVAGENLLEMANGEDSRTLCVNRVTPIVQRGSFNDRSDAPAFVDMDILACNGVIHILDKVMLYEPLPYDIPILEPPLQSEASSAQTEEVSTVAPTEKVSLFSSTDAPTQITTTSGTATSSLNLTQPSTILITSVTSEEGTPIHSDESPECLSIFDMACASELFTTFCGLLSEFGLEEDLSGGLWTAFAPTNEAFNAAPRFPSGTDMRFVLLEHLIADVAVPAEDLVCTERKEMANGKDTRTVCKEGDIYQKGKGNSNEARPEIIATNIEACNGIVHVVDQVILP